MIDYKEITLNVEELKLSTWGSNVIDIWPAQFAPKLRYFGTNIPKVIKGHVVNFRRKTSENLSKLLLYT